MSSARSLLVSGDWGCQVSFRQVAGESELWMNSELPLPPDPLSRSPLDVWTSQHVQKPAAPPAAFAAPRSSMAAFHQTSEENGRYLSTEIADLLQHQTATWWGEIWFPCGCQNPILLILIPKACGQLDKWQHMSPSLGFVSIKKLVYPQPPKTSNPRITALKPTSNLQLVPWKLIA